MKKMLSILVILSLNVVVMAQTNEAPMGLDSIAEALRGSDDKATLERLRPTEEDLGEFIAERYCLNALESYIDNLYNSMEGDVITPKAKQKEILYYTVNTNALMNEEEHDFPGGFNGEFAECFKEDIDLYMIKYVEKGQTLGYSLNCFIHVNDHWVLIPKPYRALN